MSELLIIKNQESYHKTVDVSAMNDNRLSLQAKGLHYYLQTRPDDWKVWSKSLFTFSTNGETSVRSALRELRSLNYLVRVQFRNRQGIVLRNAYVSFARPFNDPSELSLHCDYLHVAKQHVDNQVYSYNIYSNINDKTIFKKIVELPDGKTTDFKSNRGLNFIRKVKKINNTPIRKKLIPENSIISYWNTFAIQQHTDRTTRTYASIDRFIQQLKSGRFKHGKNFDKHWLENHQYLVEKRWTDHDIKEAIKRLSLYFHDSYWPADKTRLPKSLQLLIYNPMSKKSLLLSAYKTRPEKLEDKQKTIEEVNPKQTEAMIPYMYDGSYTRSNLNKSDLNCIIRGVNSINQYQNWLIDTAVKKYPWLARELSPKGALLKWYRTFLDEEEIQLYPKSMTTDGNIWQQFLEYLSECIVHGEKKHAYIFKKEHYSREAVELRN